MAGPSHPQQPPAFPGQKPRDLHEPLRPRLMPQGSRQRQPPRRSGGGLLSMLFYLFLLILVVCGSAVAYLLINPPSDLIRDTIAEQFKSRTGRELVVSGPASFTFYPGLGVSLADVAISGPPGSTDPLVKMGALEVSVKSLPLLSREVSVDRVVLTRPVFDLRILQSGRKNWDFAEVAEPVRYAQIGAESAPPSGRGLPDRLAKIKSLQLDDVRIDDGVIRFTDERTGQSQQVEAVNVKVSAASLDASATANGNFSWRGEKTTFDGTLSTVRAAIEEKPAALKFKASNDLFSSTFDGALTIKDGADLNGQIAVDAQSSRRVAGWFGATLPSVPGFGAASAAGQLTTAGNVTALKNATFGFDGATAKGDITITRGGVRPHIQASLGIDRLDLNNYINASAQAPASAGGQPQNEGDQIEKLLNSGPTKVYGSTHRAGWSSEPFNLTLLSLADVDGRLAVGQLLYRDLTVGKSTLSATLKNRVMKVNFDDLQLYDGRGRGAVTLDATGAGAGLGAAFALDGVSAQPFLTDAAKMTWLAGKARIELQVTAAGANQLQLVETLNGKAGVALADGAVVGFNLPGFVRNLSQGKFTGLATSPSEKTDFSELTATFAIANGVAQNSDLQLVSPLLRVSGAGAVRLPPRTVDYTVRPKIVASLEGQQGATGLSGIEVPVRITGPWETPKLEPDLKGVLADPNKTVETFKELGKQYKGKNAGEIVDDLFKKDESGSSKAKELLKQFLKPKESAE